MRGSAATALSPHAGAGAEAKPADRAIAALANAEWCSAASGLAWKPPPGCARPAATLAVAGSALAVAAPGRRRRSLPHVPSRSGGNSCRVGFCWIPRSLSQVRYRRAWSFVAPWLRAAAHIHRRAFLFWKIQFPGCQRCDVVGSGRPNFGVRVTDPDSEIAALPGGFFVSSAGRRITPGCDYFPPTTTWMSRTTAAPIRTQEKSRKISEKSRQIRCLRSYCAAKLLRIVIVIRYHRRRARNP